VHFVIQLEFVKRALDERGFDNPEMPHGGSVGDQQDLELEFWLPR
jgi:hypothetical protein